MNARRTNAVADIDSSAGPIARRGPAPMDPLLREAIAAFVLDEARLLDDRRYEEWAALFAEDGAYWVPAKPDQPDPLEHVSLFYDDKPNILARITRLRHPQIHVQTPASRVCHVLSEVRVEQADEAANAFAASASFVMLEYRPDWGQRLFGGRVYYRLRRARGSFEIVLKRVDLVNCDGTFPALAVPF
jgi:benzoate/toluate 1,2-dioxygenase beta subunit